MSDQLDREDAVDLLDEGAPDRLVAEGASHGGGVVLGGGGVLHIRVVAPGVHGLSHAGLGCHHVGRSLEKYRVSRGIGGCANLEKNGCLPKKLSAHYYMLILCKI